MKINRNQKGFTLIEVVLVLAIGGLIFLLAFLAFQQVSTNRRDTQRRNDASRVVAELQNFKADNSVYPPDVTTGGSAGSTVIVPTTAQTFFNTYMGGANFKDPGGTAYVVVASTVTPAAAAATTQITYRNGYMCNPAGTGTIARSGAIAIQIGLEKGTICRDDQ